MREIKSVCVFCGSSPGSDKGYTVAARELGKALALRGITLVYGGSNIGLMRAIADEVLRNDGHVIGVMPQGLIDKEVAYTELKEFHVVDSMSKRKELMAQLSDAFITMPGGIGTLDELFEIMSWNQLDIIDKPIALYNILNYYDDLIRFLNHSVDQHFVRPEHLGNLITADSTTELLDKLQGYIPQRVDKKWIDDLKARTSDGVL